LELLELQFEVKRLKKLTEAAVACLNRNESIIWDTIEEQVDSLIAEDYEKIMEEASRVAEANYLLSNLESPQRSVEIRKLYREVAKKLHPDLHPDFGEKEKQLWHAVQQAYEFCDPDSLRALFIMAQDLNKFSDKFSEDCIQEQIEF
jgi:hypothetical protein